MGCFDCSMTRVSSITENEMLFKIEPDLILNETK